MEKNIIFFKLFIVLFGNNLTRSWYKTNVLYLKSNKKVLYIFSHVFLSTVESALTIIINNYL